MQTNYAKKFNDYQLKVQGQNFVSDVNEKFPNEY